jgi:hemolysin III
VRERFHRPDDRSITARKASDLPMLPRFLRQNSSPPRAWSRAEEVANGLSHSAAFLSSLIAMPFLVLAVRQTGNGGATLGASIFATTTLLLYFCSALNHLILPGPHKDLFERLDHSAIFLLIAGTYTPFALGVLWGGWGYMVLAVIWPLALFGVLLNLLRGLQPPVLTTLLYVAMGWFMVVIFRPLSLRIPTEGLWLLLAGGIFYTGGLAFFYARRLPYHHLAWHLSVIAGTAFHYVAVWRYAA